MQRLVGEIRVAQHLFENSGPGSNVGVFFDRVLIVQIFSVDRQRHPSTPSSILNQRRFQKAGETGGKEAKGDNPRRTGRVVPSTEQSEGRSRPSLRRAMLAGEPHGLRATCEGSSCLRGPRFTPSGCASDMDPSHSIGVS